MGRGLPRTATQFPWATLLINASGCLAIGLLMSVLLSASAPPRLARPFLGVGILGGYTTFSTFATDAVALTDHDRPVLALVYLAATIISCAVAVAVANRAGLSIIGRLRARSTAANGSG